MEPFQKVTSIVTPLDKVNVDTDQIIPKQFLKLVQKSGFGKFLFFNWRYDENENLLDYKLFCLRQQILRDKNKSNKCLSDYIAPKELNKNLTNKPIAAIFGARAKKAVIGVGAP